MVLFLLVSIPLAIYLIRQRLEPGREAARGQATVSISPTSGTFKIGQSFPVTLTFNSKNTPISAIAVRLNYPFAGTTPEITVSNIQVSPSLLSSGDWNCPVKQANIDEKKPGTVNIDISCLNTSKSGFKTDSDIQFATFTLTANRLPAVNPVIIQFDKKESILTSKIGIEDILIEPLTQASYTITTDSTVKILSSPTPTSTISPSPTKITPTPTPRIPTPTPTLSNSPTPTKIASAQTTPTTVLTTPKLTSGAQVKTSPTPALPVTGWTDLPLLFLTAGLAIFLFGAVLIFK